MSRQLNDRELKEKLRAFTSDAPEGSLVDYKYVRTWGIYLDVDLFHTIVQRLINLINNEFRGNYQYICAVPPCGIPLASSLSYMLNKRMIVPLPSELVLMGISDNFHNEREIETGKRILLVDSIINAGGSARNIQEKLKSIDGEYAGLVVVLYNDTYPINRSDNFKKDKFSTIKYLFKVSELDQQK